MQVITTDALELMNRFNQATKDLAGIVDKLTDKVAELKLSTIQPALFTTKEAAKYVGIAESTLSSYRETGQIGNRTPAPAYVKVGDEPKSPVRYEKAELDRWIREDLPRFGGHRGQKRAAA